MSLTLAVSSQNGDAEGAESTITNNCSADWAAYARARQLLDAVGVAPETAAAETDKNLLFGARRY